MVQRPAQTNNSSARDLRVEAETAIEAEGTRVASKCSSSTCQCVSMVLHIVSWLMYSEIATQDHKEAWLISVYAVAEFEERDGH